MVKCESLQDFLKQIKLDDTDFRKYKENNNCNVLSDAVKELNS